MGIKKGTFSGKPNKPALAPAGESLENKKLECPSWVNPEGKKLFEALVPILAQTLTDKDVYSLYQLCHAYGLMIQSTHEINTYGILIDGKDGLKKNPAIMVFRDAAMLFNSIGSRFGMTPSDRAKLVAETMATEEREDETEIMATILDSTKHRIRQTQNLV